MDINGLRDWSRFRDGSASEIVRAAIRNHVFFKPAVSTLRERAPDADAARVLIEAFETGEAPPWLAACLLGAVRHESGYDTVLHILREHTGQLAESYAGPALARIDPMRAEHDLRTIISEHPSPKARAGAAYGLAEIGPDLSDFLVEALRAARLRPDVVGHCLSKWMVDDTVVLDLLSSADERVRRAAAHLLSDDLSRQHVRPAVLEMASRLLESGEIKLAPYMRRKIIEAVGQRPIVHEHRSL